MSDSKVGNARHAGDSGPAGGTGTSPEARLSALGIVLPEPTTAGRNRVPAVRTGNLVFLSGHGPGAGPDGKLPAGKVGRELTEAEGVAAARSVGLALLATLHAELGSLNRVRRIVKVLGMVNCAPGFSRTSWVIDGCSDLFVEVFGEAGRHARSAVGMAELPLDFPVEIELVAEIE
ncbi:MAG TPA: RidA family protein [Candidatus Saccharimonadales bacterium]|nr:RidA family protein [Candidatus Saccharimonadales bacterium]